MLSWIRNIVILLLLAAAAYGGWLWYSRRTEGAEITYRTAPVKRGDLLSAIGATGTVEPEEVIDVGAQVAGRINLFGKDRSGRPIDYGSVVEQDMVLAEIDDSLYAADVAQAQAQLEQARSSVRRAQAELLQNKAKFDQAERDWNRAQKLGPSDALAEVSYDAYKAAYDVAKANIGVSEAAIGQANAQVAQAEATLRRSMRNLGYCTIKSPVDGVIIDRRVNIGQTVVASLNAPSLFLIAKDLKRMQVWVAVNEADVGSIYAGQPVTFTVDAFAGRTFKGQVNKVRLNANMTQNVVNYTVEVTADNSDGKLLPYLTANAQFELARREDVLMVPNAALRYSPQPDQVHPDSREAATQPSGPSSNSSARRGPTTRRSPSTDEVRRGTLWATKDKFVRPIKVRIGITDGLFTEVRADELNEGMQVVIGEQRPEAAAGGGSGTNPFAPQPFRGNRGGGGGGGSGGSGGGGAGRP